MSNYALNYVQERSPFSGNTFVLHYAYGHLANAEHEWEVWASNAYLAKFWPLTTNAITRGNDALLGRDDGPQFLEYIQKPAPGQRRRFRFLFPDVPILRSQKLNGTQIGESRNSNWVPLPITELEARTSKTRESERKTIERDPYLTAFIKAYPRRPSRGWDRKHFETAWAKIPSEHRQSMVKIVGTYAACGEVQAGMIMRPDRWIATEPWNLHQDNSEPQREMTDVMPGDGEMTAEEIEAQAAWMARKRKKV